MCCILNNRNLIVKNVEIELGVAITQVTEPLINQTTIYEHVTKDLSSEKKEKEKYGEKTNNSTWSYYTIVVG